MEVSHPLGTTLPLGGEPTLTPDADTPAGSVGEGLGLSERLTGSGRLARGPGVLPCLFLTPIPFDPQYPLTNKSVTQRLLSSCPDGSLVLELEVGYTWVLFLQIEFYRGKKRTKIRNFGTGRLREL